MNKKETINSILLNRAEFCYNIADFENQRGKIGKIKKSAVYESAAQKLSSMSFKNWKNMIKKSYFILGKQIATENFRSEISEILIKNEFAVLSEILELI